MNKNQLKQIPLIIIGSARKNSNTRYYVDKIFDEIDCKVLDLLDYQISPYNYDGKYPSSDNFYQLVEEIVYHDTLIFATPVYWYSMSGLMKNLYDRFSDLLTIQKETGKKLKNKNIILLAVGADSKLPEGFEIPFKLTAEYFGLKYLNSIYISTNMLNSKQDNNVEINKFKEIIKIILL
ncbi:MAG: NAD(P)H-dependent oxidoreductase [Bacteroidetes bacterium]|nr:NAD(P)H-dependent oxidoreductase [Bacteroidota bacterium]